MIKNTGVNLIKGIGVDIIQTARFEKMTDRFITRVYTSNERAYLHKKGHISAAGLFAAKEAISKALGTGFSGIWPSQIEITHDSNGKPGVILHNQAAQIAANFGNYTIDLSISHTETDAIAFAIISVNNMLIGAKS